MRSRGRLGPRTLSRKIGTSPAFLLLKPDGTEINPQAGYRDSRTFLREVKETPAGKESVAQAKPQLDAKNQDNPMARMEYANALVQTRHYAEALTEYLWCLDEGKKFPAFTSMRLSFLLGDIMQLAAQYPPAKTALIQRRDRALADLQSGASNPEVGMDFAAYNENLGQQENTLAVYDWLRMKNPPAAAPLFRSISGLLLAQKRYADLIAGAGNVSSGVDQAISVYKMVSENPQLDKASKDYFVRHTVETGSGFYEALLGTHRTTEADALRDKLLTFDPTADTYAELIRRALRAGKPGVAQKLKESARTTLSADAFAQLQRAKP